MTRDANTMRACLRLYLVTDPLLCAKAGLLHTVREAIAGGISMVQLRDKTATTEERIAIGRALMRVLHGTGVPLIINDDIDAALAIGAHGVHVGQSDLTPRIVRERMGPSAIVGLSCETVAQAAAADPLLVDYVGMSPVLATPTKRDHAAALGFTGLEAARAATTLPAVAIGGMHLEHVTRVMRTGVDGIAVVSAVCGQPDPRAASLALRQAIDEAVRDMTHPRIPNALTIAGSDPSGGAGIQADLKTFAAQRVYGMAALTALTAQNTRGVAGVHVVPPVFVLQQLESLFDDIRIDAVKIGMIATADIATTVADVLEERMRGPVVLDPVMIAKGGAELLRPDAVDAVRTRLLPLATVITPNLAEAAHLLNMPMASTRAEMETQATLLRALGPQAVLLKGGHLTEERSPDCLVTSDGVHWFDGPRVATANTHGTGCTLSAAIAAGLAGGGNLLTVVRTAKQYVTDAIASAHRLTVGHGHGPTHHFHNLWNR
ncbi:MAG TPA: bifunctional hydroxymethylpyrimidine kinase/phosphomethylpyrimidine kinase [Gemmatimonas aurantiaca]|nr:bifunctional hydroxymethylpyrimidine kinase/phosphomethylpyrimidine kinase [Gemmatimonas aurantiaca]HCT59152.1 bifunctional hydroxymethylpyrimidine kinase/phosphomethylpyrimidine kinase [Gemmatimonas aurantiaca]